MLGIKQGLLHLKVASLVATFVASFTSSSSSSLLLLLLSESVGVKVVPFLLHLKSCISLPFFSPCECLVKDRC